MVVDCNYSQLYVIEGAPPPGGEDTPEDAVRRALTWLIGNCEEDSGALRVNFLNLNVVDFSSLATACPELAPLKKNLHGFRMLLEFVQKKFRDKGNTTALNTQLIAKFTDAVNCKQILSFAYHEGNICPEMAVPYSHFMQCVANMHRHARWVEFRIRNSQNLLSTFNHFVRSIDPLADSFHSMDSGVMTRDEVQALHNQAMDAKKDLKLAYDTYWQDSEELQSLCKGWKNGPGYTRDHLQVFLHDLKWEEHLSIQAINREIPNRNLHNLIVFTMPQAFNMWEDVIVPSERLEASLVKLAKYTEPPGVALQRMTRATKDDITAMIARLSVMVISPAPDFVPKLSDIQIIQEDLKKIMSNIDNCLSKGAEWNETTFGCTREDLVEWRSKVNATKADLDHKETEK